MNQLMQTYIRQRIHGLIRNAREYPQWRECYRAQIAELWGVRKAARVLGEP